MSTKPVKPLGISVPVRPETPPFDDAISPRGGKKINNKITKTKPKTTQKQTKATKPKAAKPVKPRSAKPTKPKAKAAKAAKAAKKTKKAS
jgi:hypothetical protein